MQLQMNMKMQMQTEMQMKMQMNMKPNMGNGHGNEHKMQIILHVHVHMHSEMHMYIPMYMDMHMHMHPKGGYVLGRELHKLSDHFRTARGFAPQISPTIKLSKTQCPFEITFGFGAVRSHPPPRSRRESHPTDNPKGP